MFDTVLVADRGVVAARVVNALRSLGVKVVSVHSGADRDAEHVRAADESVLLGDETGYADVVRVIEAAQQSRAQAVHPGVGPLAEDPGAAAAVRTAGLAWFEGRVEELEGEALAAALEQEMQVVGER